MRRAVLAGALVLAAPLTANGQSGGSIDFGMVCTPGALRACASVSAWAEHGGGPGLIFTDVFFRVSNLQGRPGFESGPYGLTSMSVRGLNYTGPGSLGGFGSTHATEGNVVESDLFGVIGAPIDDPHATYAGGFAALDWNFDYGSALWGCDVGDLIGTYWTSTCGGFVTYRVRYFQDHFTLTDATALTVNFNGSAATCTTGVDCTYVTPEPVTLVLLGSGLFGIGGALRRRREEQDMDAEERA